MSFFLQKHQGVLGCIWNLPRTQRRHNAAMLTIFHFIYDSAYFPPANTYPRLFSGVGAVVAFGFFSFAVISLLINSSKDIRQADRCENSRSAGRALLLTLGILLSGNYGGMLILVGFAVGIGYLLCMLGKGIAVSIRSCRRTTS